MTRHTIGPWKVEDINQMGCKTILAPNGEKDNNDEVASTPGLYDDDEDRANALLIAAAPELLKELDAVVSFLADLNGCMWIKGNGPGEMDMRQRAKALHEACYKVVEKTADKRHAAW